MSYLIALATQLPCYDPSQQNITLFLKVYHIKKDTELGQLYSLGEQENKVSFGTDTLEQSLFISPCS